MISIVDQLGFACFEEPEKGLSVYHSTDALRTFSLSSYNCVERGAGELFKTPNLANLGDFVDALSTNSTQQLLQQPLTPVCYDGNFVVKSMQIVKHAKSFWCNLERSLSRADNIEEGHFQERIWAGLLTEALDADTAKLLLEIGTIVSDAPLTGVLKKQSSGLLAYGVPAAYPITNLLYAYIRDLTTTK